MSSDNPPYPYYPSIPFNPSFFSTDTGGLSQATANTLYLRKTVPDTASVQETFTSGIITNSITASAVSSTMALGSNITTGNITLGSALVNNGGGKISLGATESGILTSVVQVNGKLQTNYVRTKDIIDTLQIGDDQTSGILNLGYRPADALRTGAVNIGSANATTTVYGTLNVPTSGGVYTNAVNVNYLSTVMINTPSLIQLQTFTQTNTFNNGTAGIKADIIAGIATTGTQSLYATKTGGTLNIATAQTSGTINIGGAGPVINIPGQVLTGTQPSGTNHVFSCGSNATYPNGMLAWAYNDVNNVLSCHNSVQAARGSIAGVNSTTIAFNTTSDRRLKTNIKPMKPMLETIMLMKPSEYGWVSNNDMGYGFIAQEVHKLFPEMIYGAHGCEDIENPCDCETGKPVYYGLDYGKFTPYIVKAVQELKEDYDAKLSKLEARLLDLETKPVFLN
jgi:Chaperone of endosialidase